MTMEDIRVLYWLIAVAILAGLTVAMVKSDILKGSIYVQELESKREQGLREQNAKD